MEITPYVVNRALSTALSFLLIGLVFWLIRRRAKKAKEYSEVLQKRSE